ncbi:MAG: hypothetical protein ACRERV_08495 [Methylococcales bacterium]
MTTFRSGTSEFPVFYAGESQKIGNDPSDRRDANASLPESIHEVPRRINN